MASYLVLNQIGTATRNWGAQVNPPSSPPPGPRCIVIAQDGFNVQLQPITDTAQAREDNQRTWQIFCRALNEIWGPDKFRRIWERYRLSPSVLRGPLTPELVRIFSIAESRVLASDVKRTQSPARNLRSMSRDEITTALRAVQPLGMVGAYINPYRIGGPPRSYADWFFHNPVSMDDELRHLLSDVAGLAEDAYFERLAKTVVNRELQVGQIIPAPEGDYYRVYRKITSGDGLIAYALKSAARDSSRKPLLLFRPSQFALSNEDAFATYREDMAPHIAKAAYAAVQPAILALRDDPKFRRPGELITLLGYSLGGACSQRALQDLHSVVDRAIFKSDPSIDAATAEAFASTMNAMPRREYPLVLQIYRTLGDPCHCVGEKHIGWGVTHPDVSVQLYEVDPDNRAVSAFRLHALRVHENVTTFPYRMTVHSDPEALNNRLDNSTRGPEVAWYEATRKVWGKFVRVALAAVLMMFRFLHDLTGIRILRSSLDNQA